MEILSIIYARGLYLVCFKISKLYKIPHSRCMMRQFETSSSARPTATALQRAHLQEKKYYRATAINTARITVPKRIIAQTMIPNPQGSRQTNQGPYIKIMFFTQSCSQKATCVVSCTKI